MNMLLKNAPLQRKLILTNVLISMIVLLLVCSALFLYESHSIRQDLVRRLTTLAQVIAANSTAALLFKDQDGAAETLNALSANPNIVAACLYSQDGKPLASYPDNLPWEAFPPSPGPDGFRYVGDYLIGFQPAVQAGNRCGTLYLRSNLEAVYARFQLYGGVIGLVMMASLTIAYLLSRTMQKQISQPILSLVKTAESIAERQDYSVRATKVNNDEVGLLTDAFNHMLIQIQDRDEDLRESEERFAAAFRTIPDALVISDLQTGRIIDVNESWTRLWGYTRKESLGRRAVDLGFYVYSDEREQALQLIRKRGRLQDHEVTIRRKSGETRLAELSAELLTVDGTQLLLGIIRDVTERRQAESERERLLSEVEHRASEAEEGRRLLFALLDNIAEGIAITGGPPDFAVRTVSRHGLEMTGRPVDTLVDLPSGQHQEAWGLFLPDGVTRPLPEQMPLYRATRLGEPVNGMELLMRRPDGMELTILVSAAPIRDADGNIVAGINAWRDITERKRSEQALVESERRYRTLFNAMDEGFCIVEMIFDDDERPVDYRFLEINPAFAGQTGLMDAQGKRMRELAPEHEEYWFSIYGQVALTGVSARFENRAEALDRWFDVYAFRVGDANLRQVAILFSDITERKRTEEAIRLYNEQLHNALSALEGGYWNAKLALQDDPAEPLIFEDLRFDPNLLHLLGYDGHEEEFPPSIESLRSHIPSDDWQFVVGRIIEYYSGERNVFNEEFRMRHRDGHCLWVQARGLLLKEDGEQPAQWTAVIWNISERHEWESRLQEVNASLEARVRQRTQDLVESNEHLRREIEDRERLQQVLSSTADALGMERDYLTQSNGAMQVIIRRIEEQRAKSNEVFAAAIDRVLRPGLAHLKRRLAPSQHKLVDAVTEDLTMLTKPFIKGKASPDISSLSPRELEVCRLIRDGVSTQKIADKLKVSPGTVSKHRDTIRHKLKLTNADENLRSYLESLEL